MYRMESLTDKNIFLAFIKFTTYYYILSKVELYDKLITIYSDGTSAFSVFVSEKTKGDPCYDLSRRSR